MTTTPEQTDRFDGQLTSFDVRLQPLIGYDRDLTRDQLKEAIPALQEEQLGLAQVFYDEKRDCTLESHQAHRATTEKMTKNGFDLALAGDLGDKLETGVISEIALVLPLRGALASATQETLDHLQNRMKQLGHKDVQISIWLQGIKRDGKNQTADVYFRSGYHQRTEEDLSHVSPVFVDWGVATGSSIKEGADEIKETTKIGYENMIVIPMTTTKYALNRFENECPGISVVPSTLAKVNEVGYIYQISANGKDWYKKIPADWGELMWGMEGANITNEQVLEDIEVFMEHLLALTQIPNVKVMLDSDQAAGLKEHYLDKYQTAA